MGKQAEYTKFLKTKARPIMDELAHSRGEATADFYDDLWYQILTKHPDLCHKIEQVRMDSASTEEHTALRVEVKALKQHVEELSLVVEELWKHRVKGVPYEGVAVEKFSEEETKGMKATAQVFAYKINEVIDAIKEGKPKQFLGVDVEE